MVSILKVLVIVVTILLVLIFTCRIRHDEKITEICANILIFKMLTVKLGKQTRYT